MFLEEGVLKIHIKFTEYPCQTAISITQNSMYLVHVWNYFVRMLLSKSFCRQRANFVENRRMPFNTSEGEILRSETFTILGLGLKDKLKDEKHVGKMSGKNATKKGVY